MSVQGVDLIAALREVLRAVVWGSRVASPPACQGRPRLKDTGETSPVTVELAIRMPSRSAAVDGAVT